MGCRTSAGLCLGPRHCRALGEEALPPLLGHRSLHASDIYGGGPFFMVPWATPPGRVGCARVFPPIPWSYSTGCGADAPHSLFFLRGGENKGCSAWPQPPPRMCHARW